MKFQTLSIVTGTAACQAACPFCVSKLTGDGVTWKQPKEINYRNLHKALNLAQLGNVSTVIMTGKGEPFLFPRQIIEYLDAMESYKFPFIEIQSNGELLLNDSIIRDTTWDTDSYLKELYKLGVTTILISNVGPDAELNRKIYFPKRKTPMDMQKLVKRIQAQGINVRLTTIGIKDGVDTPEKLEELVQWASFLGANQLTWRPVNAPEYNSKNDDVLKWVNDNYINSDKRREIIESVQNIGTLLYKLVHGAAVYDYKGMNLCMTNSLTSDITDETIRQLIFYPDGSLHTDWTNKGSRLL
jgi:MoaA/NifB/PqqE/SkfB family radical SAM enzyme